MPRKHALKFTSNPQQDDYHGFRLEAVNEHGWVNILKDHLEARHQGPVGPLHRLPR